MDMLEYLDCMFSLSFDKKTLVMTINGKTFKLNMDDGTIKIPLKEVIIAQDKNLFEFDRIMSNLLSEDQRSLMYDVFANSAQFSKGELRNILSVNKELLERVISTGIVMSIFKKIGTQIGPKDMETRDSLKVFSENMKNKKEGKEVVLNPLDEIKEQKHLKEMNKEDEVIGLTTKTSKLLPKKKVKK